jgi:hypothetical protein
MLLPLLFCAGCGDSSVQPQKVDTVKAKPYAKNAIDAVGVAQGDKQVSPFGKPAN